MHIDSPGPLQCLIAGCTAGESLVISHSILRGPRRILTSSHFSTQFMQNLYIRDRVRIRRS